ncbi:hypothetical protein FN976_28210 [Caenimonas sedimenti]|uniref:Uncharacterized protein n=1 Tax=Caenimonas sedimenti TaxID=2596921 RepID=A0A562ZEC1_9BURK|nr:hypothetical protein [Caenimonas sedimenti]TWO64422.1 hypothetical protein FN976_28210 [Caenimonas sedimenti]
MQTTEPKSQRVKALATRATELKQHSDNCSGQSESWSELNLDKFALALVEESISVIEQHCLRVDQRAIDVDSLKMALRAHFGSHTQPLDATAGNRAADRGVQT